MAAPWRHLLVADRLAEEPSSDCRLSMISPYLWDGFQGMK